MLEWEFQPCKGELERGGVRQKSQGWGEAAMGAAGATPKTQAGLGKAGASQ